MFNINPKNKTILYSIISLSIPTILEEVMSTLLQYVDTAMVGNLGEDATASVSVTTTISWLMGSIIGAISVAVVALIARSVGQKDEERIRVLSKQVVLLVIFSGVATGAAAIALSPFIPKWMGAEESIQAQASRYFFIINIPMVFRAGSRLFGAAIRATKDTKTPMLINLCTNVLNIVLNYILNP